MPSFAFALSLSLGSVMLEGGAAPPPAGYVAYCRARPAICAADRRPGAPPRKVDRAELARIAALNAEINRAIAPAEDPRGVWRDDAHVLGLEGDCEDYALAKRRALLALGWAPSQALIALARLPDGAPHAVLALRTSVGDLILDNLRDDVVLWSDAEMGFTHRQSALAPAMWVETRLPGALVEHFVGPGAPERGL